MVSGVRDRALCTFRNEVLLIHSIMKPIKKLFAVAMSLCLFLLFFNGITRHDVSEEQYLTLGKQKQFDCVVHIYRNNEPKGTGVIISDRYVLSAAHVAVESEIKEDTIVLNNMVLTVFQPFNERIDDANLFVDINGERIRVKKVITHPEYASNIKAGSCDLMLLEIAKPLKGIQPARLNKKEDELGADVTGCGFGVSGIASKPETVAPHNKKIAGENTIDSIGRSFKGRNIEMFADFDHPTRKDCNLMGSATPRPLEYSVGSGDSGGGLFRQKNGRWELIGICSGAATDFNTLMKTGYYGQSMSWTLRL